MGKVISQYSDVPTGSHFVIFTTRAFHIPGDERSRTNPGHGYPASIEHALGYEAFTDRAEWESRVAYLTERNQPFSAAFVQPATIKATVSVAVDATAH